MRERVGLPTDSDLSLCSFQWAVQILGERPERLRVSPIDKDIAGTLGDIEIVVDGSLPCCSWLLEGQSREVYSDGA